MNIPNDTLLRDRLDDLATGQLSPIAAWRLRRKIGRDPRLALEWAAIQGLRDELRTFPTAYANRRLPITRPSTYTIGGFTMKRRTAALAASALFLCSVTGAVAEHYFVQPDAEVRFATHGQELDNWFFRGQFRGHISLYDVYGKLLKSSHLEGSSPDGRVSIEYTDEGDIRRATMTGFGKLAVHSRSGKFNGTLVLSALSARDESEIAKDTEEELDDYLDYYRRPERVDLSDAKRGFGRTTSLPHITGGIFDHDFDHNGNSYGSVAGGSWKVVGDAAVKAQFYDHKRTVQWPSFRWWDYDAQKWVGQPPFKFALPARTLVQTVSSKPDFTAQALSTLTTAQQAELSKVSVPSTTPRCSWAIADPVADIDRNTGEWKHVLRSGTFTGYGHHVVNDDQGKPLMVLDVSPLTPAKRTR